MVVYGTVTELKLPDCRIKSYAVLLAMAFIRLSKEKRILLFS